MPKPCQHLQYTETHIACDGCRMEDPEGAHTRPIKTCTDCGARLGTCPHCKELQTLDAEGYITYHSWPRPTRQVCRGSKYSCVEDVEHAKAQT